MGPEGDATLMAGVLGMPLRAPLPDASFFQVPPSPRHPARGQQAQQGGEGAEVAQRPIASGPSGGGTAGDVIWEEEEEGGGDEGEQTRQEAPG